MTDIDSSADIHISYHGDTLTVGLPLTHPLTPQWRHNFERLSKAAGLPNTITDKPDKAWVFIPVSPDGSHSDLEARLDQARDLIAEAENAGRISANTETIIRTWWARQRH